MYISGIKTSAPENFSSELQKSIYNRIEDLGISFERVDNAPAVSMEDCEAIDKALGMKTVKTLFLCNRQKTSFYLFAMKADKVFSTKDFGKALGISRVSFVPADMMLSMLGNPVGGTSMLCLVSAPENISVVFDKDVLSDQYFGCNDCTTTCYLKLRTEDLLHYLTSCDREWTVI